MTTPSERLQALIDADRAEFQPTADATADTWSRIAHSVHAGAPALFDLPPADVGAAATAATGASTGAGVSVGKLLLVGSLLVGGGAAAVTASVSADEPSLTPASTSRVEPLDAGPTGLDPAGDPEPSPPSALAPDPEARKHRRRAHARRRHAPPAPAPDGLSEALETIAMAQRALSNGKPQRTLSLLRQRSACPESLTEDCRALRTLASCALGRPRAVEQGAQFLRRYPHSIYAERVDDSCRAE